MSLPGDLRPRWTRWRVQQAARRVHQPPLPSAYAAFGARSVVVPPARVPEPHRTWIGDDTLIHEHAWLSVHTAFPDRPPELRIGSRCSIGRMVTIACVGSITVGDDVLMAERVFIGDSYHEYQDPLVPVVRQGMAEPTPIVIGDGAFLGVGVIVLGGATIGPQSYVAAGSVVLDDVPGHTIVAGNPARPVRRWDGEAAAWMAAHPPTDADG